MLRQAFSILTVRVAGIVAAFAFLSFVSKLLSPASLGTFLFTVTTVTLLHIVVICGANNEIIRLGTPIWRAQNLKDFQGLARQGARLVVIGSAIMLPALGLLYWFWPNQSVSGIAGYPQYFLVIVAGFALLVFSLRTVFADLARSAEKYRLSMASLSLLPNGISLFFLVMAWIALPATTEVHVFVVWIAGLAATLGILFLTLPLVKSNTEKRGGQSPSVGSVFDLFRPGVITMLSHLLYQTAWHGGVLYVGLFFAGPEVALYAICLRLAELVALPGVIVPFLGQPIVAASNTARSHGHLSAAMQSLSTFALIPSALFLGIFWFFGGVFLETLFGAAYAHGALILFLVALGRCIDIAAGSAAQSVLLIKGNRKAVLMINAGTLVVLMLLLPVLASRYALDGVGLGLAIYFVLRSVLLAVVAMTLQGIATWPTVSITKLRIGLNYRQDALG